MLIMWGFGKTANVKLFAASRKWMFINEDTWHSGSSTVSILKSVAQQSTLSKI